MSFSLRKSKQPTYIFQNSAINTPIPFPYNLDISGYYQTNGIPINNTFYPALNTTTFGTKAVSTWTTRTASASANWNSVCWSPDLLRFVVVPYTGTTGMISSNGIDWTTVTVPNSPWTSVCWSSELGLFCAVAYSGTVNRIMTSPNGITWTTRTSPSNNDWLSVTWSPELGLFCAVSSSGSGDRVMTSNNGITWTSQTCSNNSWQSVCWSPELGLFCAVASSGSGDRVMTSNNGITWTTRTSAADNSWKSVTWSSELGLFVAVSETGTGNRVMTSDNGINWTIRTSAANNAWQSVTWSPQLRVFCAVSLDGTNRVMSSFDGINWSSRPTASYLWQSICWSPELGIFCSVAYDGSPSLNRVMTSSLKGRPPTALNLFDSSFNYINNTNDISRGVWNFQSFGRNIPITTDISLTILPSQNWIDCINSVAITLTLPTASLWPGREIMIKAIGSTSVTLSPAVVNLANTSTTSTLATGKWITLVTDVSNNWVIMKGNV